MWPAWQPHHTVAHYQIVVQELGDLVCNEVGSWAAGCARLDGWSHPVVGHLVFVVLI